MKRFILKCMLLICLIQFMKPNFDQLKVELDMQLRPLGIISVEELVKNPERVMERAITNFFNSVSY